MEMKMATLPCSERSSRACGHDRAAGGHIWIVAGFTDMRCGFNGALKVAKCNNCAIPSRRWSKPSMSARSKSSSSSSDWQSSSAEVTELATA